MTIMDGSTTGSSNVFGTDELSELDSSKLESHSSTQFELTNSDFSVTAVGSGLTYSGNHPTGGTITGFTIQEGIATTVFSDFSVSAATLWHDIAAGDVTDFENLLFSGNDTFNSGIVGGGGDVLNGYGGNDTFNYTNNFSILSMINGGAGNDTLTLDGDYSGSHALQLFDDTIQSVENIVLAGGHSYDITTSDGNVAAGATLTVNASALHATDALFFDGSAEKDGSFDIIGGAGSDVMIGGAGDDTFNGGAGNATVSYIHADGVTVNLSLSGPQAIGGGQGSDTFISIANVDGGPGNDVLTGNSGNNVFDGEGGHDVITGGGGSDTVSFADSPLPTGVTVDLSKTGSQTVDSDGDTVTLSGVNNIIGSDENDTLSGNPGNNIIDGGAGSDTLSLASATGGVTVDFSGSSPTVTGPGIGNDTLISIENFSGSNFNDTVVASPTQDLSYNGGGGDDTVSFADATNAIYVNLSNGMSYGLTNGAEDDSKPTAKLASVEDAIGSNYDDQIYAWSQQGSSTSVNGGAGNDMIYTYAGSQSVEGGTGNDTITINGWTAGDVIDGGAGNDTVIMPNLLPNTTITFTSGSFVNVETLLIGNSYNLSITTDDSTVASGQTLTVVDGYGTSEASGVFTFDGSAETNGNFNITSYDNENDVIGGAGNDVITLYTGVRNTIDISHGGNDTVLGGNEADTIVAGGALTAADKINGGGNEGPGSDVLVLNGDYSAGLVFGAATMTNIETLQLTAGHSYKLTTNDANVAAGSTLKVDGSQLGAGDVLTFDGSHETDGSFSLIGGAGNDVLAGGAGNDTLNGGAGIDTVSYARATGGVTVSLAASGAQTIGGGEGTDTLIGIENLIGSAYADTLTAAGSTVSLSGGGGNDVLNFGATLSAAQIANGGTGNDTLVLNGNYSAGFAFGAGTLVSIETLRLTGGNSYTLTMNDANVPAGQVLKVDASALGASDVLNFDGSQETDGGFSVMGGHGNDVLAGGAGSDTLNGGGGYDTATYVNAAAAVTVSLSISGAQSTGGAGTDTLIGIENLTGSAFNDMLTGNSGNNVLDGGAGNDTLDISAGGFDTALGDAGNDTIVLGAALTANTKIDGGGGNDTVTLDGNYAAGIVFKSTTMINVETISLAAGHSYNLTTNDANVAAGATLTVDGSLLGSGDSLVFNGSHEKDGTFVLDGGAGADVLTGGSGNDIIMGGLGADHLTGGAGDNHYLYNSAAESTGAGFDTIVNFDGATDAFDLPGTVSGLNPTVKVGALSAASFDGDLASAVGAGQLAAGHAVLFIPQSGGYAGDVFLIVDANGVAGYQAGQDFVFLLDQANHLSSLGTGNFV